MGWKPLWSGSRPWRWCWAGVVLTSQQSVPTANPPAALTPPLPQNEADGFPWWLCFYPDRSCPLSAFLPRWPPPCWCPPWCSASPRRPKALRAGAWQQRAPSPLPARAACFCPCLPQSQLWPAAPASPNCSCRKRFCTSSRYSTQNSAAPLQILLCFPCQHPGVVVSLSKGKMRNSVPVGSWATFARDCWPNYLLINASDLGFRKGNKFGGKEQRWLKALQGQPMSWRDIYYIFS